MEIKFTIPVVDLQVIIENMEFIKDVFPAFEIISDHFMVEDETFSEYSEGSSMFDWKEVVLKMDSLNNFWGLAKTVQLFKLEKNSK